MSSSGGTPAAGSVAGTAVAEGSIDSGDIADGSIVNADINATAAIAESKVANLTTDLATLTATSAAATTPGGAIAVPALQGLYARLHQTTSDNGVSNTHWYCTDPNHAGGGAHGRLWGVGNSTGQIGYSDDDGATLVPKIANPSALSVQSVKITANFMWLCCGGSANLNGQLWRSPAPAADGSGLAFTKIMDLNGVVNGPGGAGGSGNTNSAFRNSSMDVSVDETTVMVGEYGVANTSFTRPGQPITDGFMAAGSNLLYSPSGPSSAKGGQPYAADIGGVVVIAGAGAAGADLTTKIMDILPGNTGKAIWVCADMALTSVTAANITFSAQPNLGGGVVGGPSAYISTNANTATPANVVFAVSRRFTFSKHIHAVRFINGAWWISQGDVGWPPRMFGGQPVQTPIQVGLWTCAANGTSYQLLWAMKEADKFVPINMVPCVVDGINAIAMEADGPAGFGPLLFPSQSTSASALVVRPAHTIPSPYRGTMRCLVYTTEGNLLWVQTSESGAAGNFDEIWMSHSPHGQPILLEQMTNNTITALLDGVELGPYWFIGDGWRITKDKFTGQ